jgi:hypothetical protein
MTLHRPITAGIVGLKVQLDRPADRVHPCCRNVGIINVTEGPYGGKLYLYCADCGQHRGWLSSPIAQWIEHVVTRFGAPTTPIVWREASTFEAKEEKEETPKKIEFREQHIEEIKRLIAAAGFVAKDFFLTQPPPPDPKNKSVYAVWRAREQRRRRIAQLLYRCGLTAHDLAPKISELPSTAPTVEEHERAEKERLDMDMSKYMGGQFLKAADVKESGPFKAKIVAIEIGEKFKKPEATLDDGSILSLNATNCGRLGRHYGSSSDDWIGKEIELSVDELEYNGEIKEAIVIKPISPPLETSKKAPVKKPQKRGNDRDDLNDKIPF